MDVGFHGLSVQSLASSGASRLLILDEFARSKQEAAAPGKVPQLTGHKAPGHCPL
jgi:hypothetical protein